VTVPVLTAVTGAAWEAGLVAGLERSPSGLQMVRRCADLPDLLAVAATGTARAALLAAHLRRLDRDAVARLAAVGVAAVGLHDPGDDQAGARLRSLGVGQVLPGDAAPADLALCLWEHNGAALGGVLAASGFPHSALVLVGPEGGLAGEEVERAGAHGLAVVSLGPRILRTETAGPAIVAILQSRFGDLG